MKNNCSTFSRKSIRLKNYDYTSSGACFLTLCTYQRQCVFGDIHLSNKNTADVVLNEMGLIVVDEWLKSSAIRHEISLDSFVVMPNHFHAIVWLCRGDRPVAPTVDRTVGVRPRSIGALVGGFKSAVTTRCKRLNLISDSSLWQRNYYEHIIRNDESLEKIREYIANNPAQWMLDKYHPNNL